MMRQGGSGRMVRVTWPSVETIATTRCRLEPLLLAHAESMLDVLADPELYEFTGGTPPALDRLRRRYRAQAAGCSADGKQWWCNWIVTVPDGAHPVGYVQATVEPSGGLLEADLAWLIRVENQGRGLATEAAAGMIDWLTQHDVARYAAYIHPEHTASSRVASKLGLKPTDVTHDGETRWESDRRCSQAPHTSGPSVQASFRFP